MASKHHKASIGFAGGQVLAVRAGADALEKLTKDLAGTASGWVELELEDGAVSLDLAQIAYVRIDSDEPRVGFGA
jgi:hypothetical protein